MWRVGALAVGTLDWAIPGDSLSGSGVTVPSLTLNKPPPGRRSKAALFSAAGVFGSVSLVATGLRAGCMMDWASSRSIYNCSSSGALSDVGEASASETTRLGGSCTACKGDAKGWRVDVVDILPNQVNVIDLYM